MIVDGRLEVRDAGTMLMEGQEEFRAGTFGFAERTAAVDMVVARRLSEDFPWDGMSNYRWKKGS
jgi:hypothetical protein